MIMIKVALLAAIGLFVAFGGDAAADPQFFAEPSCLATPQTNCEFSCIENASFHVDVNGEVGSTGQATCDTRAAYCTIAVPNLRCQADESSLFTGNGQCSVWDGTATALCYRL